MKKVNQKRKEEESAILYESAVKDFAKFTIHNPDFFKLSREEQHKQAIAFLKKQQAKDERGE